MFQYIVLYLLTVPVFFVVDLLWIGVVARGFYQNQLAGMLGPVNWLVAVTFYLLFIVGIIVFAVLPAVEVESVWRALLLGGLFGFLAYATYDLTNLATLNYWPVAMVVVDIVWGAALSGSVATASYYIARVLSL
jgi:uncharacterized membrane protein